MPIALCRFGHLRPPTLAFARPAATRMADATQSRKTANNVVVQLAVVARKWKVMLMLNELLNSLSFKEHYPWRFEMDGLCPAIVASSRPASPPISSLAEAGATTIPVAHLHVAKCAALYPRGRTDQFSCSKSDRRFSGLNRHRSPMLLLTPLPLRTCSASGPQDRPGDHRARI